MNTAASKSEIAGNQDRAQVRSIPTESVEYRNKFQSEKIDQLASAMAKAQGEFPTIGKNKTAKMGSYEYAYADLADIIETVKPILAKNGLSHTQEMRSDEHGNLWLWTTIMHSSGQWRSGNFPLKISQRPQETGSAITYARRYTLAAALGIQAEDDDDAQAAQTPHEPKRQQVAPFQAPPRSNVSAPQGQATFGEKKPSEAQMKRLFAIAKSANVSDEDIKVFLKTNFGKNSRTEINVREYDQLCDAVAKGAVNDLAAEQAFEEEPPFDFQNDIRNVK